MKTKNSHFQLNPSSFRDPSGYLFTKNGVLLRNINQSYRPHYQKLLSSGLFQKLCEKKLLINHQEVQLEKHSEKTFKTIRPEKIPFISYPYEWCFSQLQDAALLTLEIQKTALEHGITLKDASAFNLQFFKGKPILIDSLSFESYKEGAPWVAYRQFCQHFLAPLALMAQRDLRLNQLFRSFIDGIPLELASSLLPKKSYFNPTLLIHLHLHAKMQQRYAAKPKKDFSSKTPKISKDAQLALISSLENAIKALKAPKLATEWGDYYSHTNYSSDSFAEKKAIIKDFLAQTGKLKTVWDLGGNTGVFSRIAANQGIFTLSFDLDPLAVEKNYQLVKTQKESRLLPLVLDLTNPSSDIGWAHQERASLQARANADLVMALAIVHHLCISNNLPFEKLADYFSKLAKKLIIEFVPKSDSNVKRLLASRKDIFPNYTQQHFEQAFSKYYQIKATKKLKDSARILYLMETR